MKADDVVKVDVTDEMINKAWDDQQFFEANIGAKSRPAVKQSRGDFTGSMGHQAVESLLTLWQVPFEGLRKDRKEYGQGDYADLIYDEDVIDVKTHFGQYDPKYFYNHQFLVFQKQIDNPKFKLLTHLLFVLVSGKDWDIPDTARIFGVISVDDFLKKSTEVKLIYDNRAITPRNITPLRDYIFRI